VAKWSAGLLLFRCHKRELNVFLVHPGGPFWLKKEFAAWSIPKGEVRAGEDLLVAAKREFTEETGFTADGRFIPLGEIKQTGGKIVTAWAVEQDCSPLIRAIRFRSNGPPNRVAWRSSRKSIAPNGFRSRKPEGESSPDKSHSSTAC